MLGVFFEMRLSKEVYGKLCGIFLVVVSGTSVAAQSSSSRWMTDNDKLTLLSDDSQHRRFIASDTDSTTGLRSGAIVFDGTRKGQSYFGILYIYTSTCGRHAARAIGKVDQSERLIFFSADAPEVKPDCSVGNRRKMEQRLRWIETIPEDSSIETTPENESVELPPDNQDSRIYLRNANADKLIVLDTGFDGQIIGEVMKLDDLTVLERITGVSSAPDVLTLDFTAVGQAGKRRLVVGQFRDALDAGTGEAFAAYWQPIDGSSPNERMFVCGSECNIPTGDVFDYVANQPRDWTPSNFYRQMEGNVCVMAPGVSSHDLQALITSANIVAVTREKGESFCGEEAEINLSVPHGREVWTIRKLNSLKGVKAATIALGPAGGSWTARLAFLEGTFIPADATVDDFQTVNDEFKCKISSRFKGKFRSVELKGCEFVDNYAFVTEPSLCVGIRLEGHTADSTGFSVDMLPRTVISDKYLVATEIEVQLSQVTSTLAKTKALEKMTMHVVQTQFARQPQTSSKSPKFKDFESFGEGRSNLELDGKISGVVQRYLGPVGYRCDP